MSVSVVFLSLHLWEDEFTVLNGEQIPQSDLWWRSFLEDEKPHIYFINKKGQGIDKWCEQESLLNSKLTWMN